MLGPHVTRDYAGKKATIDAHIHEAVAIARNNDIKIGCVAIFVSNPNQLKIIMKEDEARVLKLYLHEEKIDVIAHSSYKAFPWNDKMYGAAFIRKEVNMCHEAGIKGLVVHLPSAPPEEVTRRLLLLYTQHTDVRIYLETPWSKPDKSHYETPKKLKVLFEGIRTVDPQLRRVGLCIDTAHLWVCGVDLSDFASADAWFRKLESYSAVIPAKVIMLHLNDCVNARGSGRDEHAPLMRGKIWGKYIDNPEKSGLAAIIAYAVRNDTPIILERKNKDLVPGDYKILYKMSGAFRIEKSPEDLLALAAAVRARPSTSKSATRKVAPKPVQDEEGKTGGKLFRAFGPHD